MNQSAFWKSIAAEIPSIKKLKCIKYDSLNKELILELIVSPEYDKSDADFIRDKIKAEIPNLNIRINHELDNMEKFNKTYIEALFNSYKTKYPWLDHEGCFIDINDGDLLLEVPNKTITDTIHSNEIIKYIKDDISRDCGKKIEIRLKCSDNFKADEFFKKTTEKEKDISMRIMKNVNRVSKPQSKNTVQGDFYIGKKIKGDPIPISSLNQDSYLITIKGRVFDINTREIKGDKYIVNFHINDDSGATTCKAFWSSEIYNRFMENIKEGSYVLVNGKYTMDSYMNCYITTISSMTFASNEIRQDLSEEKRVEMRLHSQMSALDGFVDLEDLYKRLSIWGHKSIAITDKAVVQAYPQAMELSDRYGIKTLYGLDADVVEDYLPIVSNFKGKEEYEEYVVFDLETTGLSHLHDKIIEIGAVKIKNGLIVDTYRELVDPKITISTFITELTTINNETVAGSDTIDLVLPRFLKFCGSSCLVAHNAEFDISFIKKNANDLNLDFDLPYIDTLYLARYLLPELRNHKLDTLSRYFKVKLENHHRADEDSKATANIFLRMRNILKESGQKLNADINYADTNWNSSATRQNNMLILAKTQTGLKNLYKIISHSHTKSLYKTAKIPRAILEKYRDGLIIGSGNIYGELIGAILNSASDEELESIVSYYDFLEVLPHDNYEHLIESDKSRYAISDIDFIKDLNRKIVEIGDKTGKLVVATGDVFYLDKKDHIYRDIVKSVQFRRDDSLSEKLYLKTTDEMLDLFSYFGADKAYEIIVKNTNIISDSIEDIRPIPKGKFPPVVEGSDVELREITYNTAKEIYGDDLPEIVSKRLDKELNSIINNGYSVLYIIARKLVLKSNEDGYLVGSRGSVGSSFAATMAGITEVNPLVAHYICPNCKNSEFITDGSYDAGIDMPDKNCPKCGTKYKKEGHNIPFEVFLGFKGNKEPDIDLNFAGEYQAICHKYTEELFGKEHVFRAGTIGTIADNTAYGYIKKYYENTDKDLCPAEIALLQKGIVGCKRTTGQHPGGIMIVPNGMEIEDFTPINYPADDPTSETVTTHFTYKAVHETILKLDLLGHDVPSIIKMLSDLTGIDSLNIPMGDEKTMQIFRSIDSLNYIEDMDDDVGTLGIPEFGTGFVRQMLKDTRPTTFSELVRISGLSHGTNVWLNNAQELIRNNMAVLNEVICTRDDIMTFLIQKGMDDNLAFKIMESVRKGRGLTEDQIDIMNKLDLPSWYVDSCQKIKYMFPKAHAVAYVLMSYRIAYFKVHHPLAFYATYFTTKLSDFPGSVVLRGIHSVKNEMERIKDLGKKATQKELGMYGVLEVAEEMYARGIKFTDIRLGLSKGREFSISEDGYIIPPYCSLEDVSEQCSVDIYNEYKNGEFISIQDLMDRTKTNKTALETLKQFGVLDGLNRTNQIDLFDMI
ncbi:MAG: PolC-type DNA polymerase III [Tissierellia bacterium]|nr:PolC-type DNA polymerase III [Tissierellia bacterium]